MKTGNLLLRLGVLLALLFGLVPAGWATQYQVRSLTAPSDVNWPVTAFAINNSGVVISDQLFTWTEDSGLTQMVTPDGFYNGEFVAINNNGRIVGNAWADAPDSNDYPVVWNAAGVGARLNSPGCKAYGINDSGQVVGSPSTLMVGPVLWNADGAMLPMFAAEYGIARDINNNGVAVGWYINKDTQTGGAFRWSASSGPQLLPTLGGSGLNSRAIAINDNGQIIGTTQDDSGRWHNVLWNGDLSIVDLGLEGGFTPYAINNAGQIVGQTGTKQAALRDPSGNLAILPGMSGSAQSLARGINDNGWVVGQSDEIGAVLWTPVPEPSSLLALAGGITGLGGLAIRRRRD